VAFGGLLTLENVNDVLAGLNGALDSMLVLDSKLLLSSSSTRAVTLNCSGMKQSFVFHVLLHVVHGSGEENEWMMK